MRNIKRIDIKEFRDFGYLQEVNRQFFHPLGLALEVIINDETGDIKLGGVWDFRDEPDGMIFGEGEIDASKAVRVDKNCSNVQKLASKISVFTFSLIRVRL